MSSNTLREKIKNKLLLEESNDSFSIVEKNSTPCPRRPWTTCEKAKKTKINLESGYMLGIYCDDQECKVTDSNVLFDNTIVLAESKE